jgi:LmbE family N-acetylglucosaminyl deacetylase
MLNGLWAVGITNYPVFGSFPDFFTDTKHNAYSMFSNMGYTEEDIMAFVVENIRRYKPMVAIGHDPLGEYSHGQHMVYSEVLQNAVQKSMNEDYFPESAQKYGVWDVPKTYLHLYEENPIFMNWDTPLESFNGMTAFQVSKELGFACHVGQLKDFSWYLSQGKTAAEFRKYNPCEYGLFRGTVGEDVQKNDFFENVLSHGEEKLRKEAEEAARLEAERLAEEEARKQAELEQAQKQEEERRQQLELQQQAEREAEEAARQRKTLILMICGGVAVAAVLLIVVIIVVTKQRKNCRY